MAFGIAQVRAMVLVVVAVLAMTAISAPLAETAEPPTRDHVDRLCRSVRGAVLLDAETGQPLYTHLPRAAQPPASTVKLMLLLLAAEEFKSGRRDPDDPVVISRRADDTGGQQLYLAEGDVRTLDELALYVAVHSANDAAVALAEGLFGSYERSVTMMNARAKDLGLTETRFRTPHGLPASWGQQGDRASAMDLAVLGCEAVRHQRLMEWCATERTPVNDRDLIIVNANEMLGKIEGVDGLKTGFTQRARWCLIATAKRDGRRLVCSILGAPSSDERFRLARALLDYGFGRFEKLPVLDVGDIVATRSVMDAEDSEEIRIASGAGLFIWSEIDHPADPAVTLALTEDLVAPIRVGQEIGNLFVHVDGWCLGRVPAISIDEAKPAGGLRRWIEQLAGRGRRPSSASKM